MKWGPKTFYRIAVVPSTCVLALAMAAACSSGTSGSAGTSGKALTTVRFYEAATAPNILFENIVIGEKLGYFAEAGIQPVFVDAGTNDATLEAGLENGQAQVAVGVPANEISLTVQAGHTLPTVNYYEYTYPSKYWIITAPNSPITSLSQLTGKSIGVVSLGTNDSAVLDSVLKSNGVSSSGVKQVAVGLGTPAYEAMASGKVAALMAYDTELGTFDTLSQKYKVLLSPNGIPRVGGFYIAASRQYLNDHQNIAVGFAQAVAKGTLFALANPSAAASIYLSIYPNTATGDSLQTQVSQLVTSMKLRAEHWLPYTDPGTLGAIQPAEWQRELTFDPGGSQITGGAAQFYTNAYIKAINNFDHAAITQQAKNYKS